MAEQPIIIKRYQERRPWRPSRRRLEGCLCRFRDGDDGLLPAAVAVERRDRRATARRRRLFCADYGVEFKKRCRRHARWPDGRGRRDVVQRHHAQLHPVLAAAHHRSGRRCHERTQRRRRGRRRCRRRRPGSRSDRGQGPGDDREADHSRPMPSASSSNSTARRRPCRRPSIPSPNCARWPTA